MRLWRYSALGQTHTHKYHFKQSFMLSSCAKVLSHPPVPKDTGVRGWPHPLFRTRLLSPWAFEWGDVRPPFDLSKALGQRADHMR